MDISLTFDNGPEPDVTPGVLDVLAARDLKAAFFVMGQKLGLSGRRVLTERAKQEGHLIGNHTWSHGPPLGLSGVRGVAEAEIGRTFDLLGDLGEPERLFRPNAGGEIGPWLLNREAAEALGRRHYTCVTWNAVPRDYSDPEGWVERALAMCEAQRWTVLVLHDLPNGAMRRLPFFLDEAIGRGARFRQDYPTDCLAMVRGEATPVLEGLVSD